MALYDWRAFGGGFHPDGGEVVEGVQSTGGRV